MASSDDAQDPAAAFDALRAEVRVLRQDIAKVLGELKATQAPDVTPTLKAMVANLDAISVHPAMKLTPKGFAEQINVAAETEAQAYRTATLYLNRAVSTVNDLQAHHAQERSRIEGSAGRRIIVILAVMVCTVAAQEIILRTAPADWGWREGWASHFVGHSPWDSGLRLMEFENAKSLDKMLENDIAVGDQADVIQRCQSLANSSKKAQRCMIVVKPRT